jgi:hypothetical protein
MLIHELDPFDRPAAARFGEALGKGSFRDAQLASNANRRQLPAANEAVDREARDAQQLDRLSRREEWALPSSSGHV